ncbi:MAG: PBP1A family penicillin-binding protein [Proteobacteria bacterium]|nr:PBP1A family penicillin-binding protein [Pseudomonadota bacterium]MBU1386398.1 PBP1A family penicillin-binding protein [Pseudomonadota bacterium]MBU1544509.1 PBP1A family penicillin-binding protein [Pseudomonadota bacterium]MBU2429752.1 PBP1A family penicillin-binding protein [Pseudomonadota bacterium]MBU2480417.1 PBP1A family penicillin-binding protein [Pseudomonadota bacterium]
MKAFFRILPFIRFVLFSGLILVSLGSVFGMCLVFYMADDLPKLPSPLSRIIETPQTQILASNGQLMISLGERESIPLDMVSQDFINAIIATEDHRFYEHRGINKLRTLKGLYITLTKTGKVQGASTITQQLAKNLFFSFEQTFTRKFKELLVALQIEASSTKQEILHAYINQIYFGAGAQGIEKAANVFFGKSSLDLTLSEAALLAGLPKSPANYNPYRHYDRALERRNIVLRRMVQVGFISDLQAQKARLEMPELHQKQSDSRTGNYFIDALISELIQRYGEDVVYHGGIKVFSTVDPRLQTYAQNALKNGLKTLDDLMGIKSDASERPQGALVSIEVGTGAVKALVGGRDYHQSEYNRAMKSRRQPGSGFKPFLYYTAFKNLEYHPATLMTDKPVVISVKGSPDWMPKNFNKIFEGDMILKKALIDSVNTVAAQLVEKTGPASVNQTARICGIKSPLADVYSVALGTSGVTPFEMASAYAVFATMGVRHEPFLFKRVEDAFGRVIFEHIIQEKRVLESGMVYQVVDMMKSVIDQGSGSSIRKMGFDRPAAGKTGTTDGYNDAWFTGFTPTLSTCVWTGFDKKTRLVDTNHAGITGGRSAAPIWADFMRNALKSDPERDFPIPDNIRFETVDVRTGCNLDLEEDNARGLTVALKSDQHLCEKEEE